MNDEGEKARTRVWDPLVRLFHWSLLVGFFTAYFTRHSPGQWHEWFGYFVLTLVFLRVVWGMAGSRYARFRQFLRTPRQTLSYLKALLSGRQPRYLGHNPLGGWMTVMLILSVLSTCISGWLFTTDRFWGIEWVEDTHNYLTNFTFLLIALHVVGVVFSSFHEHENLVASMIHGFKRNPAVDDID